MKLLLKSGGYLVVVKHMNCSKGLVLVAGRDFLANLISSHFHILGLIRQDCESSVQKG